MVATPDDSRTLGYMMFMWISGCSWCGGTFNVMGARLREVMRGRNYLSRNDYLSDRWKSLAHLLVIPLRAFANQRTHHLSNACLTVR